VKRQIMLLFSVAVISMAITSKYSSTSVPRYDVLLFLLSNVGCSLSKATPATTPNSVALIDAAELNVPFRQDSAVVRRGSQFFV
jgi:hypothetical protein